MMSCTAATAKSRCIVHRSGQNDDGASRTPLDKRQKAIERAKKNAAISHKKK